MQRFSFEIGWGTLWKLFFFVLIVSLMVISVQILLALFLAIIISSGLEFLISFLERRGVPRAVGVIFIFLMCASLVVILAYTLVPLLIVDLNTILLSIDRSAANYWLGPLVNFQFEKSLSLLFKRVSTEIFSGDFPIVGTFSNALGGVGLGLTVLASSFYLCLTRDGIARFIRAVMPAVYEPAVLRVYYRSRDKIAYWFRTQVILSVLMGGLTWLTLYLLGVKHALLLGVLAGIFELLPFIGPIIAGAAATLSAMTTSPALAASVLIAFVLIHQLESHVLVPVLTRRSVGLHPVIVIVALLIGIKSAGMLGALVSIPAAAVIQEALEEWTKKGNSPDD
jgi:predicted PurR-regulated permease PerM